MPTVLNQGYEVDLSSWTARGAGSPTLTPTRDTVTFHSGVGSARLVQTVAGADGYYGQDVDPIGAGFLGGSSHFVSAWVNCTNFQAAAVANRGLMIVTNPIGVAVQVDLTAATSGWTQLNARFTLNASDTGFEVRLYSPQGTVFWDDIQLDTFTNSAVPTVTGSLNVGSTLTANPGTWTPSPSSFNYYWHRADDAAATNLVEIGATGGTYTLSSSDVAKYIRAGVIPVP